MSFSYYWAPVVPPPPPGGEFSIGLADLLARWISGDWGDHAVDRAELRDLELGQPAVGFLSGVLHATDDEEIRTDAAELIAAIQKHGLIRLSVER